MSVAGLLLTPGAGTGADHPSLIAIENGLAADRLPVCRMDFPYRQAGRRAPDRAPVLVAAVREGAAAFATKLGVEPGALALGGRSMGGRMCSMAIAEGWPAAALICIAYPLHPPGKPERLRTEHLRALTLPCLFISGTRDAFGRPDELEAATAAIPGPVTHVWLDGADHSLRRQDEKILAEVRMFLKATG
jgi:predicted alpha/beta-hydrolase family hydrolase